MHLFAYGTLMFPEIWHQVAGTPHIGTPAAVHGYAAYRVKNAVYPGLVAEAGSSTGGEVFEGLDEATLLELDAYESDFYSRVEVIVLCGDGRTLPCETYVVQETCRAELTDEQWDAGWFEEHALHKYLAGLREEWIPNHFGGEG